MWINNLHDSLGHDFHVQYLNWNAAEFAKSSIRKISKKLLHQPSRLSSEIVSSLRICVWC